MGKVRMGFVSNSSSSSFVVVAKDLSNEIPCPIYLGDKITIPRELDSETSFSMNGIAFDDYDSKLNFLVLQALYADNAVYLTNIEEALVRKLGPKPIVYNLRLETYNDYSEDTTIKYGQIDHQSVGGDYCTILLADVDKIYNFLFSKSSYLFMTSDSEDLRFDKLKEGVDLEKYLLIDYGNSGW